MIVSNVTTVVSFNSVFMIQYLHGFHFTVYTYLFTNLRVIIFFIFVFFSAFLNWGSTVFHKLNSTIYDHVLVPLLCTKSHDIYKYQRWTKCHKKYAVSCLSKWNAYFEMKFPFFTINKIKGRDLWIYNLISQFSGFTVFFKISYPDFDYMFYKLYVNDTFSPHTSTCRPYQITIISHFQKILFSIRNLSII